MHVVLKTSILGLENWEKNRRVTSVKSNLGIMKYLEVFGQVLGADQSPEKGDLVGGLERDLSGDQAGKNVLFHLVSGRRKKTSEK